MRGESGRAQYADHSFANGFFVVDYCDHWRCTTMEAALVRQFQPSGSWTLGVLPIHGRGARAQRRLDANADARRQLHKFRN